VGDADGMASGLALPPVSDAQACIRIHERLLALRDGGAGTVVVDASEVVEASTAVVQLLEAAAGELDRGGRRLALERPSEALCTAYEDLGLFAPLMARVAV